MKIIKTSLLLAAATSALLTASLPAATLYWDGDEFGALGPMGSSGNATDAPLDWLHGNFNGGYWDDGATSTQLSSWNPGDSAVFGSDLSLGNGHIVPTITLSSAISVGNLTFGTGGDASGANDTSGYQTNYTIDGGTLALMNGSTFTANTDTIITSAISLSAPGGVFSKAGSALLTLNGEITLAPDSRINNDGTNLLIPGGANLLISGGIIGTDTNLSFGGAGDIIVSTAGISIGAGSLTKDGTGTLTLQVANDYAGVTQINQGAIEIQNGDALGDSSAGTIVMSGAALRLSGDITVAAEGLSLAGTGVNNDGALRNVSGANTYAGAITLATDSRISADAGSSLTLTGGITGAGNNLTVGGAGDTVIATTGIALGSGSLIKEGKGTLTLAAANNYTGDTTVNGGTLHLDYTADSADRISSAGLLSLGDAALVLTGNNTSNTSQTVNGLTLLRDASSITVNQGTGSTDTILNLGAITRAANTTLNITYGGTGTGTASVTTSNANDSTGLLGTWATVGTGAATRYATVVGGNIVAYTGATAAADASELTDTTGTVNYDLASASGATPGTVSANTIRYTGGAGTTTTGATGFTVNGLMHAGTGLWTIDGATPLTIGATQELVVNSAGGDIAINSVIQDNGGGASNLIKNGANTLTLSGLNTFTGDIIIGDGTLAIDRADPITLSNLISGGGALEKKGAGTLTLNRANTYTGVTTVSGGTLSLDLGATAAGNVLDAVNTVNLAGGTLDFNGADLTHTQTLGSINVTGGANRISTSNTVTPGTVIIGGFTYSGGTLDIGYLPVYNLSPDASWLRISDLNSRLIGITNLGASITANGGQDLVYVNATGDFVAALATPVMRGDDIGDGGIQGIFKITDGGSSAPVTLSANQPSTLGILNACTSGTTTIDLKSFGIGIGSGFDPFSGLNQGLIISNASDLVITDTVGGGVLAVLSAFLNVSSAGNVTIDVPIIEGGGERVSLIQNGPGKLILSADNPYTGETTVNGGTLQIGAGGTTGTPGTGEVRLQNNSALVVNRSDTYAMGNLISGTGTLTNIGTGILALTRANTYDGLTTVSAGAIEVQDNDALGTAAAGTVVESGGALRLSGGRNITTEALTISGTGANSDGTGALRNVSGANTYASAITLDAASRINSDSGLITLSGVISGTNGTENLTVGGAGDTVVSGVIATGTGELIKDGAGRLTLTGVNTYTGATTVSAGTLAIGDTASAATARITSDVFVAPGGTLTGTGTIDGTVSVSGGILANTQGATLTTTQAMALSTTSSTNVALTAPGSTPLFQVNGDLALEGTLNVDAFGAFGPGVYRLFNYTGNLTADTLVLGAQTGSAAGISTDDLFVRTNLAGEVTLINTGGLKRNVWDGPTPSAHDNSTIQGGTGFWIANDSNWANDTGTGFANPGDFNRSYNGAATIAIFRGASGTVTVDNTAGVIVTSGMFFETDGYIITGAPLTLANGTGGYAMIDTVTGVTATLDTVLQGAASVVKFDEGTLVLSRDNTYTGTTTISAGTVRIGNGGAAGSFGAGEVIDNGAIVFDRSNAHTVANLISGTGTLTAAGSGTTILTADNTYSGTTTVSAGTLQVGAGGATGSFGSGAVVNNAAIVIDRSNDYALANAVSGSGTLTKRGAGALILTADNTYAGTTTVSVGTLKLGSGGTTGSLGSGAVVNNAAIVIDRSNDFTVANAISGTGTLAIGAPGTGAGTVTLTGNNTYTGATSVNAGKLVIGEGSSTGDLVVNAGGSLGGGYHVTDSRTTTPAVSVRGNLTNLGTLNPGFSPGTLNVSGNFTQGSAGVFTVEIASPTDFDKLVVTGTASLNGTLEVVSFGGFTPSLNQTYTVLTADGGVSGTFASLVENYAALKVIANYNPNDVTLSFELDGLLPVASGLGLTPSQTAAAGGLDAAILADPAFTALAVQIAGLNNEQFAAALANLSPQSFERLWDNTKYNAAMLAHAVENRMQTLGDIEPNENIWMQAVRRVSRSDADGDLAATGYTSNGVIIGADTSFGSNFSKDDKLSVGAMFSYSNDRVDLGRGGKSTVNHYLPGIYTRYRNGDAFLEGMAAWGYADYSNKRTVAIGSDVRTAKSHTEAQDRIIGGRAGYEFHLLENAFNIAPFAGFQHTRWEADGFTETGAGLANLSVHDMKAESTVSRLGLMMNAPMPIGDWVVSPKLDIAWRHEFQQSRRDISANFGPAPFTVRTTLPARDALEATVGLDVQITPRTTIYADFGTFWDGSKGHSEEYRVGVNFKF